MGVSCAWNLMGCAKGALPSIPAPYWSHHRHRAGDTMSSFRSRCLLRIPAIVFWGIPCRTLGPRYQVQAIYCHHQTTGNRAVRVHPLATHRIGTAQKSEYAHFRLKYVPSTQYCAAHRKARADHDQSDRAPYHRPNCSSNSPMYAMRENDPDPDIAKAQPSFDPV